MPRSLASLIEDVPLALQEATSELSTASSPLSSARVWYNLNAEYQGLGEKAGNAAHYTLNAEKRVTIAPEPGTSYQTTPLPNNIGQIKSLVVTDGSYNFDLSRVNLRDPRVGPLTSDARLSYEILNGLIRFRIPRAGSFRLLYTRRPARLSQGTAGTITDNSIALAATPTYGQNEAMDDAYVGEQIYIVSATTGANQVARVTAYNASTRVCTLSEDWAVTPTGTVVYSILPFLPDQYYQMLVYGAAMRFTKLDASKDCAQLRQLDFVNFLDFLTPQDASTPRFVSQDDGAIGYGTLPSYAV